MTPEELKLLHDTEQAEKRAVDLIRQYPKLLQTTANDYLTHLTQQWADKPNPGTEFLYHVGWIGCIRVMELDEERAQTDEYLEELEDDNSTTDGDGSGEKDSGAEPDVGPADPS
jgi:hypothetical protein